ncbi:MAG: metallopeptidase TldD-related protein [Elusimicrobiota bacterium]
MVKDLLRSTEKQLKLEIGAGEVRSFRNKEIVKTGARIFDEGKIASASFVGQIEDSELYRRCMSQRDAAVPFDYELPRDSSYSKSLTGGGGSMERLPELTEAALRRLKEANRDFLYSGHAACSLVSEEHRNSLGVDHRIEVEHSGWAFLFKHKSSAGIMDGWFGSGGIGKADPMEAIERNLPFLEAFGNEVPISEGPKPVVYTDLQGWLFRKLCESLRIDKHKDGSALYSGRMGERLFSEDFSLYDVSFAPEYGVASPFDGEGTLRKEPRLPLIEKGSITNLICDLRCGKKYGAATTGNGQRGFNTGVHLGFNALAVGRGERPFDSLIKEFEECVFVVMAMGGDCTDTGEFSSPVALSYLFKNGKLAGRLPQITVKSGMREMFGPKLLGVSSDGFLSSNLNPCVFMEMQVMKN